MHMKIMHHVIVPVIDKALALGPRKSPQDTGHGAGHPSLGVCWIRSWARYTQRSCQHQPVWNFVVCSLHCLQLLKTSEVTTPWGFSWLMLLEEWVVGWLLLTAWRHDHIGVPLQAVIMCSCCLLLLECSAFPWMKINFYFRNFYFCLKWKNCS